jgi:MFS family permease
VNSRTRRKLALTLGQAAPLLLAPLSEVYGRNGIYLVSAIVFAILFIPQGLAQNITTILVTRFLSSVFRPKFPDNWLTDTCSGIAGSTAVSLVGGTLADVWTGAERGLPMALFAFAAFASTGLGPTMFGYV